MMAPLKSRPYGATEILLLLLFFVPSVEKILRVESYKNLKQNSWMAKGWVDVTHKRLMQQNSIEMLQSNRELLLLLLLILE